MEKNTRFLDHGDVEIERDGTRYTGTYSVADGIVTVCYRTSSRKAHVGRTAPEVIAEFLLDELVADHQES